MSAACPAASATHWIDVLLAHDQGPPPLCVASNVAQVSFVAHVLVVLIAAPGDTAAECEQVEGSLASWNVARGRREQTVLMPWRWTKHAVPSLDGPPQSVINRQAVDQADIVIAIFDARLGQQTPDALSGTVEEIDRAQQAQKPVHVYFSREDIPRSADLGQLRALQDFRADLERRGLVGEYADPQDLGYQVRQAIELDIDQLGLGTPTTPRAPGGAVLRSRHHHEKNPDGVDSKGKPKFRTVDLLFVRNEGSATAKRVVLDAAGTTADDQFSFWGPDQPFDLLPQAERSWPLLPLGACSEIVVKTTWHEGDEQFDTEQTISV